MLYYLDFRGRALGPFTEAQLRQNLASGRLSLRSRISTDKLTWMELGSCRSVLEPEPDPITPSSAGGTVEPGAQTSPVQNAYETVDAPSTSLNLPSACETLNKSFKTTWRFFVTSVLFLVFATTILLIGNLLEQEVVTAVCAFVALASYIIAAALGAFSVYGYVVFFYAFWKELPQGSSGTPSVSPGCAVGLMFAPVFGLYWTAYIFLSCARRVNALVQERGLTAEFEIGVPFAIVTWVLNFFFFFPFIGQALLYAFMKRLKDAAIETIRVSGAVPPTN